MSKRDHFFVDSPVSVLVVAAGDGHGTRRTDRFDGVRAVLFGAGGSLNIQQRDRATMYEPKLWRSWKVLNES